MDKVEKRIYCSPIILQIEIDKDISLQLQSDVPPAGPDEIVQNTTNVNYRQNPFRL